MKLKFAGIFFSVAYFFAIPLFAISNQQGNVERGRLLEEIQKTDAVAQLEQDGVTDYFASFGTLLEHVTNDAEIVVLKDCVLTNTFKLANNIRLRGEITEGGDYPILSSAKGDTTAGLVLASGAELTVENLTFRGFSKAGSFIYVDEGATLTLEHGAVIDSVTNTATSYVAPVFTCGTLNIESGAAIRNCRSKSPASAVLVYQGATLNLIGGELTGNRQVTGSSTAGAIYATKNATINLSGAPFVEGNIAISPSSTSGTLANIYLTARDTLYVAGALTGGKVGIKYGTGAAVVAANSVSNDFATVSAGVLTTEEAWAAAAAAFVNDVNADLVATSNETQTALMWSYRVPTVADLPGYVAPEDAEANAVCLTIGLDSVTNYWSSVPNAFAALTNELVATTTTNTVVLLAGTNTFSTTSVISGCVTLRSADGETNTLVRTDNASLVVGTGASLTIDDLHLDGDSGGNLLWVERGTLELGNGALVRNVAGSASRSDGAIVIYDGGTFVLREGATICDCSNSFDNTSDNTGAGGAVLVDVFSTAYLYGGTITGCSARKGGGVYAGNESTVYLSGEVAITGNFAMDGTSDNLRVEDKSELYLEGELTGSVGYREGPNGDTNVFGKVTAAAFEKEDLDSLAASVTNFQHDVTQALGVLATNETGTAAILVWSTAFAEDGTITVQEDGGDVVYAAVGEIPVPTPEPEPEPTPVPVEPTPIAFTAISNNVAEATWTVTFTNLVPYCTYSIYQTNSLAGGFETEDMTPVTNFTATAEGASTHTFPADGAALFWKVVGRGGEKPVQ